MEQNFNFRPSCLATFAQLKPGSTFLTVHKYTNVSSGKIADWSLVFHFDYKKAIERSKNILSNYKFSNEETQHYGQFYLEIAKQELLDSFQRTIDDCNYCPSDEAYDELFDADNNIIKGVKLHRKQNILHLVGFVVHSRVIQEGIIKRVNHSQLTQAKMLLKSKIPISKFVQFKLEPGRFEKLVVENKTIKIEL